MKGHWLFLSGAVCGAAVSAALPRVTTRLHGSAAHTSSIVRASIDAARVHTEEKFAFTVHALMEEVTPLFGAKEERGWSPRWNPQFIYPLPAADAEGMVFTVKHSRTIATWVNTDFDVRNGRVRYVYIIPDAIATVITLSLKPEGSQTNVEVKYDRTALNAEADAHVRQLAKQDRQAGPDWEAQVNGYLEKRKGSKP